MAVVGNQSRQFDDLRKKLQKAITDKAKSVNKISIDIGEAIVDLAVHNSRKRLDRATPKNSESEALIQDIKNNIVKKENKKKVKPTFEFEVKPDPENLYLFLEYGTGIVGENHWKAHSEEGDTNDGWGYGLRRESYITRRGKTGWFFPRTWTYIDASDENPVVLKQKYTSTKEWVKTNSSRYHVKGYSRTRPHGTTSTEKKYTYPNWVFSEGLKPLRYFSDTRNEIVNIVESLSRSAENRIIGSTITLGSYQKGNIKTVSLEEWKNKVIEKINSKRL